MKYIDVQHHQLVLAEGPKPSPKAGEVLIRVRAAGVNRPDVSQRRGAYPPPPDASPILGLEVAGIVEEGAAGWKKGDRVCALANGGGYAEFCAVPHGQCLPIPAGLDFVEAASLPENAFTVWGNVFDRGRLQAGETLLVHGGASGIGSTAIQYARAFGAEAVATVRGEEKRLYCEKLGARAIDATQEDFAQAVKEVDVVLDMVGGSYFAKNIEALAMGGRLVQIACMEAEAVTLPLREMMRKRLVLTGSMLRPQTAEMKAKIAQQLLEKVWPLYATGRVKPTIYNVLPLEEAADAHRLLEAGRVMGKVVLLVGRGEA